MTKFTFKMLVFVTLVSASYWGTTGQALSQGRAALVFAEDCKAELAKFCSNIVPGDGRKVACLISYSDKVSPRCRLSAYIAGKTLADNILRLERLAWKCSADIPSLCSDVLPGGGRIYQCLRKNKARLLPECRQAMPVFESEFGSR